MFNVGTGVETDVNALFGHINRHAGAGAEERHGPAKPGEQQRSVLDVTRAREALGWEPTVTVADGLEQTVAWFREREAQAA